METIAFAGYLPTDVPNVLDVRGFMRRRSLQMPEFRHFAEYSGCAFGGRTDFGRFVISVIVVVDRIRFAENGFIVFVVAVAIVVAIFR